MSELRVDTITDELGTGSPDFPNGITVSNATFTTLDINDSTINNTAIGNVTPSTGAFTSVNIDGGNIDGTAIGSSSASSGAFTTLTASDDVNFDSGTLFVDASADAVGIGTTSPDGSDWNASAKLLHIYQNTTNGGLLKVESSNTSGVLSAGDNNFFIGTIEAQPTTFYTNSQPRMTIDSSGNVGIGVTPSNIAATTSLQISTGTFLYGNTGPNTGLGTNAYNDGNWKYKTTGHGVLQTLDAGSGVIGFYNAASGTAGNVITWNERMRIDSSGNVLIGKTALGAAGGVDITPTGGLNGVGSIGFNRSATSATSFVIVFQDGGANKGYITYNNTGTLYQTVSDYRLKENAQPITGALAKVWALNPVQYNWKTDGSKGEGFIAHELQEIVPYAVTGEKDGEQMQAVDYGKLTTLLTAAIKELKAELDELKGSQ